MTGPYHPAQKPLSMPERDRTISSFACVVVYETVSVAQSLATLFRVMPCPFIVMAYESVILPLAV